MTVLTFLPTLLRRGRRPLILATAFVVAAVAVLGIRHLTSGPSTVQVTADFADASPLVKGNVVKAAGVDVGTITGISLDGGVARVTMAIDRDVLPLHQDATMTITTQDLLGERFVSLDTGSASKPALPSPYELGKSSTTRVVDLQDVLNSLDEPTSQALAALITGAGEGLKGQGKNTAAALKALEPAMTDAGGLASVLDDQNDLLGKLVDNAEPVAKALSATDGAQLDHLVASATTTLHTLAASRTALEAALKALPSTMESARATLARLAGVAQPTTKTLADLRPVSDDLSSISTELHNFSSAADPALASLPAVLHRADDLLDQAAPVVTALRPATASLRGASTSLSTLSDQALSKHLDSLMEFVKGWAMATNGYDAISHYFRAMVPLSPDALDDIAGGIVPGLPKHTVPQLPLPTVPQPSTSPSSSPSSSPSASPSGLGGVVSGLTGVLGGVLGGGSGSTSKSKSTPPDPDSVTGLDEQQENNLLSQLLGGL